MQAKFITVRIGEGTLPGRDDRRWEVRVVRGRADEAFLVWAFDLEGHGPHPSVEAAVAHAERFLERVEWRASLTPLEDEVPCASCAAPTLVVFDAARVLPVCKVCALEAVDASGRGVRFVLGPGGTLMTDHDDGTRSEETRCWIRGTPCSGRLSRFGWTYIVKLADD